MNKESHGLKVAQLSGMPPSALAVAHKAMSQLGNDVWVPSFSDHVLRVLGESLISDDDRTSEL